MSHSRTSARGAELTPQSPSWFVTSRHRTVFAQHRCSDPCAERRARHDRERAIEKARRLVVDPGAYTRATSHGAVQYVRNLRFDKEAGEAAGGSAPELDLEAIAEVMGLEELKLKNLTTGKAREILAKAAKWKIPHAK